MSRRSKRKSSKTITVDFTGVEVGGRTVPPGEYVAAVDAVRQEVSNRSNKPFLAWELRIVDGDQKGSKLFHNTSLQPQALWNLRQMLEAMGVETDEGVMTLDLDSYVGLQLGVEVDNEEYDGKNRSRVVDVFSLDDIDEDEDEEDLEDEEEDEEDEEEEDEVEDEEDEDEEDEDEDDKDEDDEDEDDEEEEEEAPAPRRRQRRARR